MRKLLVILGIPIDDLNMNEVVERIVEFVAIGRRTGKNHQIATVNADFVVKSLKDPELRYLLQGADLATADGMPLVWGARLLGVPLEGRVTGADLVPALAERAAQEGFSIYLYGAGPGIASSAAQVLRERHPQLRIVGAVSPPYSSVLDVSPAVLNDIRQARPDILLVALGNPKQEKFIGMYGRELGVPVMIGVGGTLDFIAGKTRRAPAWMQKAGIEWTYRLAQEPRRLWKRYVVDLVGFSSFFVRQWWVMRRGRRPATLLPTSDVVIVGNSAIVSLQGRLDLNTYPAALQKAAQALEETTSVILNLQAVTFLDSAAIGALVGLTKQVRDRGGDLLLAGVPENIARTFALLRLEQFFTLVADIDSGLEILTRRQAPGVQTLQEGKWTVLSMPRRLDAAAAPAVTGRCQAALAENPWLILDLSQTAFLTSAGLAVLSQLNKRARELDGEVRLAGCTPDVRRVIELVRFDRVFDLHGDVAAAVTSAAPAQS